MIRLQTKGFPGRHDGLVVAPLEMQDHRIEAAK